MSYKPPTAIYAYPTDTEEVHMLVSMYLSPQQLRFFIQEAQKILDSQAAKDWATHLERSSNAEDSAI